MGNNTPHCHLGMLLSLLLLAFHLQHVVASSSASETSDESAVFYPASFVSYGNYSQAQCFALGQEDQEVDCLLQMLNTTDPPSIYNYWDYNALWEPVSCLIRNVTLGDRADDSATFNYCTVPLRGYDSFLFVSLALLATSMLFGKLSAVFVLIVGGILGVLNYYVNLLQISNSISLWLSIQPADLFFYAFLPPLLVDTAIRIDFFMFRKIWVHALFMAFVMVVLSAIALTPFILFVLGFQNRGWSWVHGALLAAIISPTDALAVASILAKANGPERVVAVMEGESLFNDASAITLFEVFAHLVYEHMSEYPTIWPSVWSVIPTILLDIVKLSVIGVAIGLAMSWATWHLLRWLRWRGARPYIETTVVLAVAYLSYYVTNSPAKGSGVIAVVVFGLYGNATSKWGMLASAEESGAFDAVWDMISFSANGLVFFWSGVASVNFFIRSADLLPRTAWSYGAIPLIYIFMMLIRCLCVALFNPVFNALGEGLSKSEIFFIGFAGLRGSVSLIMVSAFATGTRLSLANADEASMVYADISLWASAFVVLTLVINGPMIAPVLRWLKLNIVPKEKMKMRSRAKRALCRFTDQQINELRDDDDEFLQGANWDAVAQYVDLSGYIENFDYTIKTKSTKGPSTTTFSSKLKAPFRKAWAWLGTTVLWPGRDDALKVADVSTPSKQPATDIALGATTSKRLGRKKSSGSENGSALSQPTTTAVTTTSSSGGSSSSNTASPVRNLSEQQDTQKFGVYIPKESSAESPLAGAGGGGGSGSSSSDRELPSQQRPGHHHVHDPWTEITAEELAREMHEECPFFTTTEEEEQAAQGAAGGGGGGDIELGTMGGRASTSDDAVVAAALAASSSQKPSYAAVTKATPIPSLAEKAAAAAAATAAGMASGASPPSASREGSVRRGSSINLASIIEGQPMEEQDQLCLTGTAGAKLLSELRRTMSKGEQTLPPDYYASLPAGAGAKLKQQLQQELGSLAGPSFAADSVGSGGDQEEEGDSMDGAAADYYCSLPALAGKKLQEELRQATEAAAAAERRKSLEQQPAAPSLSSPAAAAAAAAVSAAGALEASSFNANPDYYTSMPAAVGRNVREELQRQLAAEQAAVQIAANIGAPSPSTSSAGAGASGSAKSISTNKAPAIPSPFSELASLSTAPPPTSLPVDATTSLPAATGKAMQAELQRRLRVNVPGSSQHSRRGSVDGSSPRLSSPRISGGRPPMDYYSYHATVSGVSGSNLATELKERLRSGPLSKHGSERDLLGRKVAPKQQGNAAANLPPIPPFPSSQRPPQQPQQQQQQQQQPLRQPLGGPSSHFRSISLTADRTMAAAAPISMALLDKNKSNLHAFRRTASTVDRRRQQQQQPTDPAQLFRPSTAESQNPKDTTAATTTITENGSGSSPRGPPSSVSKKFSLTSSFLRRGAGVAADASAVPPNNDPSAMLLARTFSVGASLHRRGRPGGGVSMARSILDEDVDEDASTTSNGDGGGDDASDGAGGQRQNSAGGRSGSGRLMMDQRTISATTLREGSFDKRKDGDVFGAEEAFFEAEDTEMLAEMRVRLLAGLKRHYVAKRLAGLLSVDGLRILQYACDVASDHAAQPLQLWASLEKEVSGSWTTRVASRLSLWTTRGYRAMHPFFQKTLSWPFKKFAGLLRRFLGRKMLVACEVAVEYYVSLLSSPQIQWLKGHGEICWRLLDEVEAENEAAHHFLIEREIEAPDRFQAIQSYRAAMAVLRQQMLFVGELFETGMIDESEQHGLHDPIDRKMRHLELVGPVWRPPRPKAVLRSLPFMAALPEPAFRKVYDTGSFIEFRRGQCIWTATDLVRKTQGAQGPGGFVVLSGVVKRVHIRPDGGRKEYFQGSGGIIGVLLCITGTKLPGTELAIAEGNALGKGPVVFHIPQQVVQRIQTAAANGDGDLIGLEEELARLSAAYVVESMDVELVFAVSGHLEKVLTSSATDGGGGAGSEQQQQYQPLERAGSSRRMSFSDVTTTLHRSSSTGMARTPSSQHQYLQSEQQQHVPRRVTSDANVLHTAGVSANDGGAGLRERRATAVSQSILPLSGAGLSTSKSVGANLAAMMQQIAALEYEEDDDDDGTEGNTRNNTMMDRTHSSTEFGDVQTLSRRSTYSSFHGRRSFEEGRREEIDGGAPEELETMMDGAGRQRPSSPTKRGVRFSTAMHHNIPDAAEVHRAAALNAALHRAPQLAADVSLDIRRALHTSFIMKLDPGSYFIQTSHVVLIAGSLEPFTGSATTPEAAVLIGEKSTSAPAVLPWLWHDRWVSAIGSNVSVIEVVEWQVGWQGAHVVVAYNSDGTVPDCVLDYEDRMEEKDQERKANELTSFPLSPPSPAGNSTESGMKRVPSHSGSESGSLRGTAAAGMKDALMGLLRRSVTEPIKSPVV